MNVNSGIQEATKLEHPMLIAECKRKGPEGFTPIRQYPYLKNLDKIRKQFEAKHGKDNVVILKGHCQRFTRGGSHVEWFKEGCVIYVKDQPKTKRRTVWVNGKEVEAGRPDWSKPCISCGMVPTEPNTNLCGPCCFGEWATDGGKW